MVKDTPDVEEGDGSIPSLVTLVVLHRKLRKVDSIYQYVCLLTDVGCQL